MSGKKTGQKADFAALNRDLLNNVQSNLFNWLPGGRVSGNEFEVGDLTGTPGRSLRVNLKTGKWADFSTDVKGGDLISLYAAINGLKQIEAYRKLGGEPSPSLANGRHHTSEPQLDKTSSLVPPPDGIVYPDFLHKKHGLPIHVWKYHSDGGDLLFFVARYDTESGKQFIPWSFCSAKHAWVNKAWSESRPLYNLHLLDEGKPVLIVEGEKACDAASEFTPPYTVVTWSGGAKAWRKTDFSPIYGRKVLLWPDADEPGVEVMHRLAAELSVHCPEVKIITPTGHDDGWDAADSGFDWSSFKEWAVPRAHIYAPTQAAESTPEVLPPMPTEPTINVTTPDQPADQPISVYAAWESMGLSMTQKAGPIVNVDNVVRILERWDRVRDLLWFDEFHQRLMTGKPQREWRDVDDSALCVAIQRDLGIPKMQTRVVREGVELFAAKHARNEAKDWMESVIWDKSPRIDSFFTECFGSDDTEYVRSASKNFWLAMVARVFRPGCKFDNMVVLEGKQGRFKSTALSIIGGRWFMESVETIGTKDFLQSLNGKLLVEIAELDSFSKADVRSIKKTISCQIDTYRASYARRAQDFARQCVFVGTTNEDEYLEDATGGRRFWPIRIGSIDLDLISTQRDQLFAEAVARFKAGEEWWNMPDSAEDEQESRRRTDAWEDVVLPWLTGRDRLRLVDIAKGALDIEIAKFDKRLQMRLAETMRSIGWVKITGRNGSKLEKLWVRGPKVVTHLFGQEPRQSSIFEQNKVVKNFAPGTHDQDELTQ